MSALCPVQSGRAAFLLGLPALSCLGYGAAHRLGGPAVVWALDKGTRHTVLDHS